MQRWFSALLRLGRRRPNTRPPPLTCCLLFRHYAWPRFAYSVAPIRRVKGVNPFTRRNRAQPQFFILKCVFADNAMFFSVLQKAYSVAKIEVMDEATPKPRMGGLMDPRMGTIDCNFKHQTCGEGMSECPVTSIILNLQGLCIILVSGARFDSL